MVHRRRLARPIAHWVPPGGIGRTPAMVRRILFWFSASAPAKHARRAFLNVPFPDPRLLSGVGDPFALKKALHARPKSVTFGTPSFVINTFWGFGRGRWVST